MPVYHFHLGFGGRIIPDDEGIELRDRAAAREEACAVIRELSHWRTVAGSADRQTRWFSRVSDDEGPFLHLSADRPQLEVVAVPRPPAAAAPLPSTHAPTDLDAKLAELVLQLLERRERTVQLLEINGRLRRELSSELRSSKTIRSQISRLLAGLRPPAAEIVSALQ
jgi:hypothetical protein